MSSACTLVIGGFFSCMMDEGAVVMVGVESYNIYIVNHACDNINQSLTMDFFCFLWNYIRTDSLTGHLF